MKNDILYDKMNGTTQDSLSIILRTLASIQQKVEHDSEFNQHLIEWQQSELKRLQHEVVERNNVMADLHTQLHDCQTQAEGNRQLINKLITDIDRLQQAIEWYKRTYETRSLAGIIKDKLKHFFIR
jgi:peptidoglycan hydrolase CwlO-like protein